ncbi:hypothetical protein ABPG74_018010 [Tetrahymena malaccensis]
MILQGSQGKYILSNQIIGQGGFSQVFQGQVWQDYQALDLVAIKIVSKITSDGKDYINYQNEVAISQKIFKIQRVQPCQYIMNIIDICQHEDNFYIVTQYYQSGDFLNFLDQNFEYFTLDIVLDILIQIAKAINYLHQNDITHRDLKPENILISKQDQKYFVKVADFGSATVSDFSSISGTPNYMAPEIFNNKNISNFIDIWSFGCLAYEILTKQQFFNGRNAQQIVKQILQYSERQYKNQNQNDQYFQIHQLIQKYCLQPDPEKRQSAQFIIDELSQLRTNHQQELKTYDFELVNSYEVVFQQESQISNNQIPYNGGKSQQKKNLDYSKSNFQQYKNEKEIQQLQNYQKNSLVKVADDSNNDFQDQIELKASANQSDDSQSQTETISISMDDESRIQEDQLENENNDILGKEVATLDQENQNNNHIEIQQVSQHELQSSQFNEQEDQLENENKDILGKEGKILNQENNHIEIQQVSQHELQNNKFNEDSDHINSNEQEANKIAQKLQENQPQNEDEEYFLQKSTIDDTNKLSKQYEYSSLLLDEQMRQAQNKENEKVQSASEDQISKQDHSIRRNTIQLEENKQDKGFKNNQNSEFLNQIEISQVRSSDIINQNKQLDQQNYSQIKKNQISFFYNYSINRILSYQRLNQFQKLPLLHQNQIQEPYNIQISQQKQQQTARQNQDSSSKLKIDFFLLPFVIGGISELINKFG